MSGVDRLEEASDLGDLRGRYARAMRAAGQQVYAQDDLRRRFRAAAGRLRAEPPCAAVSSALRPLPAPVPSAAMAGKKPGISLGAHILRRSPWLVPTVIYLVFKLIQALGS